MPPCLLAIRSLLGSSRRQNISILNFSPRFQRHSLISQSIHPWRSFAHNRHGIAVDGETGRDEGEEGKKAKGSKRDSPAEGEWSSTPSTTQRSLGSYTSMRRQPSYSPSESRGVMLMVNGEATGNYSSEWQPRFAKLQLLKYAERQDEDEAARRLGKLVHFDRETVELARKVQKQLMQQERESKQASARKEQGEEEEEDSQDTQDLSLQHLLLRTDNHEQWYDVMLWLLAHSPEQAMSYLRTTHTHHYPYPPIHAVQDSLRLLADIFHQHPDPITKTSRLSNLAGLIRILAHRSDGETLSLPHGTLAKVLPALRPKKQLHLWECVQQHQIDVYYHTYLHFASRLARADYFDQALDAVSEAHRKGANLTSHPFLSTCSTLLRAAMRQPSGLRVCLRVVDHLVGMGVTLNLILCNIIMLNAVEANDLTTAWSIYHSLPNYGLKADDYTFAVLLKACKVNLDDADMLNETIRNAIANVDVKRNSILASDIIHTLALHHTKRHPEKAFETLADAYSQLFDTTPLADLGILPVSSSLTGEKKMQPTHAAIGIMLTTYLQQLFLQTQSPTQPRALFHRYRALVTSGVEPWCSMIDQDYIPNAFLMTLTKTKAGIVGAAEIIKTMQRPVLNAKVKQCEPTVQSWTIFMHGFQRHGQMKMAEQVLEYMRGKGVEPDQVTWNVLVEGYALLQDVEGVDGVLERLKEDGRGWDEWTGQSVGKLKRGFGHERRSRIGDEGSGKELDFTGDLREKIARRIAVEQDGKEEEKEDVRSGDGKYTPIV